MNRDNSFPATFKSLTGNDPFPWQEAIYQAFVNNWPDAFPTTCRLPTGVGKTLIVALWLIALAHAPRRIPRRLVYVVNRRTVVDQTTREVERLRKRLVEAGLHEPLSRLCALPLGDDEPPLAISTLRGQFADNGDWSADPARPAIIIGTVDMIGSRLLFGGYGIGPGRRPLHAGFLGQDALLVHDEAHLEPAFQDLLRAIEAEQDRERHHGQLPWPKLRVLELSATTRDADSPFGLTPADLQHPVIQARITATKRLVLHPIGDERKQLAEQIIAKAREYADSGSAVLIFVRSVEDAMKIADKLPKDRTEKLTGTMRGLERDRLVGSPVFQRFLPERDRNPEAVPAEGTVWLVCTSAGEVGVNLSAADHPPACAPAVCDLTTFENMVQRLGRVNRFGAVPESQVDVFHPELVVKGGDAPTDNLDERRARTLALLRQLDGDGSSAAIDALDPQERSRAFAPLPEILPATDILFDAWALTAIRGRLPGRPPLEPYLHGVAGWEPPQTRVAWREEVEVLNSEELRTLYPPRDLLADYPLKPHELLQDRSDRVFKELTAIARRHPEECAWLIDRDGDIECLKLEQLADKDLKEQINDRTVLLPPRAGGLSGGFLDGRSIQANDVSDEWYEDVDRTRRRRVRVWDGTTEDATMRLIRPRLDMRPNDEDEAEGDLGLETESETSSEVGNASPRRYWYWYSLPRSADDDLSATSSQPIRWDDHTRDVVENVKRIGRALGLPEPICQALELAAEAHDLGKQRVRWQRGIGNPDPTDWYAKSGRGWIRRDVCPRYRHELGSLLDLVDPRAEAGPATEVIEKFQQQPSDIQELVLHLIAAHHGYARPHFPAGWDYDPDRGDDVIERATGDIPRRFASLQRRYGRWGLTYLESLLRAADWAASANPSNDRAPSPPAEEES